jgi:hypothetical protein
MKHGNLLNTSADFMTLALPREIFAYTVSNTAAICSIL